MKNVFFYPTDIGKIGIAEENGKITNLFFRPDTIPLDEFTCCETDIIKQAYQELTEYFRRQRKAFDLPLQPQGTPFMLRVWNELLKIPYGQTRSYQEIAEGTGNPNACRAVGLANRKNPIPIFIPCHRVIGKNGNLVGFGGGLELKNDLLKLEKR